MDAEQDCKFGDAIYVRCYSHTRLVSFHAKEVPGVLRRCYEHLGPVGYIGMQDLSPPEPPGAPEHTSKVIEWPKLRFEAVAKIGGIAGQLSEALSEAGFVDVQVQDHKVPVGPWMEDEKMKVLCVMFLELLQRSAAVSSDDLLTHLGVV